MIPPSPRSSCALLCLALATSIGLGPLPLHAAPASSSTSTAPADPRSATARDHYSAGRYAEAARLFEAIWRDGGRPNVLYNAGMAREAAGAGHEALALVEAQVVEQPVRQQHLAGGSHVGYVQQPPPAGGRGRVADSGAGSPPRGEGLGAV